MPLIQYIRKDFSPDKLALIAKANSIIREYNAQGFNLTLRQLYYQFVARDLLPQAWADRNGVLNRPESYNKLGDLISDGRISGLIDWNSIVDRSRSSYALQHWLKPSQIVEQARRSYAIDKWDKQPQYVEVWVEKEALEDVLARACNPLDVRYFACKGYTSQSAMWEASQRLVRKIADGKEVHIIHLGDHDPSGIDMTRDIYQRLSLFVGHLSTDDDSDDAFDFNAYTTATGGTVKVHRIALNMNQVEQYQPPPNPAKTTDSRFRDYQIKYGDESWELDALEPGVLVDLIQKEVLKHRDEDLWEESSNMEERGRGTLRYICMYFPDVVKFLQYRKEKDDSPIVCAGCLATQANPTCLCDDGGGRGIALGPASEE